MKVLLVAVNAKYIHSNLAVYSLRQYARKELQSDVGINVDIELAEYTINQLTDDILMDLYSRNADVLCFSCYIWNREFVERLTCEYAKVRTDVPIWLGGPEVSYDACKVLGEWTWIRGIMKGEGEKTFAELCFFYGKNGSDGELVKIEGITFRRGKEIIECPWRSPMDLSDIPFVYEDMTAFEHRIIYYESSRGCPFSCSYCLSSIDKKLRFRSLDLVKRELQFFIDHRVPQVKFVDRTFNCRHGHSTAIWRYIKEHDNGITNFHFEVAADLLTEEELSIMEDMRPGLIQLEIGVQSSNPQTIAEIRRMMNLDRVADHVARVRSYGNIHQHLDLIAGLPYEDLERFKQSFDDVYRMCPDQLQLGFLKVLKGSFMEEQRKEYQIHCKSYPPYEVLSTKWLSYDDIIMLKMVEDMVESYYNSGQFGNTMAYLVGSLFSSPYELYESLGLYYREQSYHLVKHKRSARYEILLEFIEEKFPAEVEKVRELLIFDYFLRENAKVRPDFAGKPRISKEDYRDFFEMEAKERKYLCGYENYIASQIRSMTHLEVFPLLGRSCLFDYQNRDPLSNNATVIEVEFNGTLNW